MSPRQVFLLFALVAPAAVTTQFYNSTFQVSWFNLQFVALHWPTIGSLWSSCVLKRITFFAMYLPAELYLSSKAYKTSKFLIARLQSSLWSVFLHCRRLKNLLPRSFRVKEAFLYESLITLIIEYVFCLETHQGLLFCKPISEFRVKSSRKWKNPEDHSLSCPYGYLIYALIKKIKFMIYGIIHPSKLCIKILTNDFHTYRTKK